LPGGLNIMKLILKIILYVKHSNYSFTRSTRSIIMFDIHNCKLDSKSIFLTCPRDLYYETGISTGTFNFLIVVVAGLIGYLIRRQLLLFHISWLGMNTWKLNSTAEFNYAELASITMSRGDIVAWFGLLFRTKIYKSLKTCIIGGVAVVSFLALETAATLYSSSGPYVYRGIKKVVGRETDLLASIYGSTHVTNITELVSILKRTILQGGHSVTASIDYQHGSLRHINEQGYVIPWGFEVDVVCETIQGISPLIYNRNGYIIGNLNMSNYYMAENTDFVNAKIVYDGKQSRLSMVNVHVPMMYAGRIFNNKDPRLVRFAVFGPGTNSGALDP